MTVEIGRICIKTRGRERSKRCVIVDIIDKNFVLVTGPREVTGVKRRRVNVKHLSFTNEIIKIKRGASDKEVVVALRRAGEIPLKKAEQASLK